MATTAEAIGLSKELLCQLDRLAVQTRRAMPGQYPGERRSPRAGTSVEFADFRTYVPGDDFRRIDWNAYARLDRLVLKLYLGEEDLAIHLWVDTSASMDWGQPSKMRCARQVAAAVAYVGLARYDRVGAYGFAEHVVAALPLQRGPRARARVWGFLAALAAGGSTDYEAVRMRAGALARGISIVLSDFLTRSDPAPAVAALRAARQEVVLLQLLAPDELRPALQGDLRLRDVESEATVEVTVTPALQAAYSQALEAHTLRLQALARAHGALFHRICTAVTLETVVLETLRRIGLLR